VRGENELMVDNPAPNLAGDHDPFFFGESFRRENRCSGDETFFFGDFILFTGETTVSACR